MVFLPPPPASANSHVLPRLMYIYCTVMTLNVRLYNLSLYRLNTDGLSIYQISAQQADFPSRALFSRLLIVLKFNLANDVCIMLEPF